MKKRYQRSRSSEESRRRAHRYSKSRSRDKAKRKSDFPKSRSTNPLVMPIKVESDIKNHFRFQISTHLNSREVEDTEMMLKSKLTEYFGPVEHITRSRERHSDATILNLGFKYDIDAYSYLEGGKEISLKTSSHKIKLNPTPTKAFELVIAYHLGEQKLQNQSNHPNRHSNNYKKSQKSSQSSKSQISSRKRYDRSRSPLELQNLRKKDHLNKNLTKMCIFGIAQYATEHKVLSMINQVPNGPYTCINYGWKRISRSVCEYFEFLMDANKARQLMQCGKDLQLDGRPVLIIEDAERLSPIILKYQINIQLPKPVNPISVIKALSPFAGIVQLLANQQIQQDGRCANYNITLNDKQTVTQLKKLGRLSNGIWLKEPKSGIYVYRPTQHSLLPTRHQHN